MSAFFSYMKKTLVRAVMIYFIIESGRTAIVEENRIFYKPAEFAKIAGTTKRALPHYRETGVPIPSFQNGKGLKEKF